MSLFTLKGDGLIAAITALGCTVNLDQFSYITEYTVTRGDNTIATFDLCPDGAFRFGTVMGIECIDWLEFSAELQEATQP